MNPPRQGLIDHPPFLSIICIPMNWKFKSGHILQKLHVPGKMSAKTEK